MKALNSPLKWTEIIFQNWSEYPLRVLFLRRQKGLSVVARSQILLSQTGGLELDAEEQGVAVAGVAARQVLRD